MLHALKTVQPYFNDVKDGIKRFEVRKDDRPFGEGDDIVLQEWDEETNKYTGEEWHGEITMVLRDANYCKKGFCILGIRSTDQPKIDS